MSATDNPGLFDRIVAIAQARAGDSVIALAIVGCALAAPCIPLVAHTLRQSWSNLMIRLLVIAGVLATTASPARADTTAVRAAPGEETGRTDRPDEGDSMARIVARGALFVPRLAVGVVFYPLERAVWVFERYQLPERLHRLFWNADDTVGLLPTVQLESGFGLNIGAHLVLRDLFGRGRFDLRTNGGGRFQEYVSASLRIAGRGRLAFEAHGDYERRPKDTFFGIGNSDEATMSGSGLVDPIDGPAIESRFRHRMLRVTTTADLRITDAVHLRSSGSLADHEYEPSDVGTPAVETSIDSVYMIDRITGFGGHRTGYGELELRWDTRRAATRYEPAVIPSTGWLLAGFAGRLHSFDRGSDTFRYGVDAQRFLRLGEGPRVIALRAHVEGVTGGVGEVPFDQLPRLGGGSLRGYPTDRFRDRIAAVGSADYRWDLVKAVSASVFVDAGRVYRDLGSLSVDAMRVGYGVALEAHSNKSFLARVSLASSIDVSTGGDGGVFLDFALDPVFELDGRVQRR